MLEISRPDVTQLISNARDELVSIAPDEGEGPSVLPIPEDIQAGRDVISGTEPPAAAALRKKVASPIPKGIKDRMVVEASIRPDVAKKNRKLEEVHWLQVGDGKGVPQESPDIFGEREIAGKAAENPRLTEEQRKFSLDDRFKAQLYDKNKYFLRSQVLDSFYRRYGGLHVEGGDDTLPEELKAMVALSGEYGLGRENDYNAPDIYRIATLILRAEGTQDNSPSRFRGMEGWIPAGAAERVLKGVKEKIGEIEDKDIVPCMIAALACGGPLVALEIASLADKYAKPIVRRDDQTTQSEVAISRFTYNHMGTSMFDKAYELSPESVKKRTDAELATLSQTHLQELLKHPGVDGLVQHAKERMDSLLQRELRDWYKAQRLVDIPSREAQLSDDQLKTLYEKAAEDGEDYKSVQTEVTRRSEQVVDGKIANSIGAELVRRLSPEYTVDAVAVALKDRALGKEVKVRSFGKLNEFNRIFDTLGVINLSTEERKKKVDAIRVTDNSPLEREFDWRGTERVKALVVLLKNPGYFSYAFGEIMKSKTGGENQAIAERFGYAMIQGIQFLQTVTDNEQIKRILETEMGMKGLLEDDNLDKAQEALMGTFSNEKHVESKLTLYDTSLGEGQIELDTEALDLILRRRNDEIAELSRSGTTAVRQMMVSDLPGVTRKLEVMLTSHQEIVALTDQRTAEAAKLHQLTTEADLLAALVVGNAFERIAYRDRVTLQDKTARINLNASQQRSTEELITAIDHKLELLGSVTELDMRTAQKKAEGLARLVSQAHSGTKG